MQTKADLETLCHEFTSALTEILAETAVGPARRGRVARAHAAIKKHPEYNEHTFCVAVEAAFTQCGSVTKRRSLASMRVLAQCLSKIQIELEDRQPSSKPYAILPLPCSIANELFQ
jgi:hypothetical protein